MISLRCLIIPRLDSISFRIKFYTVIILYGVVIFHAREMVSFSVTVTDNFYFLCCLWLVLGWRCFWNWCYLWRWSGNGDCSKFADAVVTESGA